MLRVKVRNQLAKISPALPVAGLALGALALLWRVRDVPLVLGAFVRFDALSAFFLFALFGGAALLLAARPASLSGWLRPVTAVAALTLAYSTTLTLLIASAYLALALLTINLPALAMPEEDRPANAAKRALRVLRRAMLAAPSPLAASCLLLGSAALALRGAARYDDRTAGAALDSFVFWFVLLAALIACAPLFQATTDGDKEKQNYPVTPSPRRPVTFSKASSFINFDLFRLAWLYPLARLYSLGPWNSGWSFATLLLGGGLALWCAGSALVQPDVAARNARLQSIYLALALAGLGLSNSAGIVAACYGVLAFMVLSVGHEDRRTEISDPILIAPISNIQPPISNLLPWLLSSAVPLTAPFVAAWMLMGASVAGGVALLAGVVWLVALLHGLAGALWNRVEQVPVSRRLLFAGVTSVVLGVGAPPIARLLILPVVAQLQGGLTPFGELNIWPWVGVATSDSAHTQVTTLPSIAIALLLLVLSALVYVVARLREFGQAKANPAIEQPAAEVPVSTLLSYLRAEVPWLGGLLGAHPRSQRQPGDGE
jgi:hypothetical protein